MEMVLRNSSAKELAHIIKNDNAWLTQQRQEYIINNRTDVLQYLDPSQIDAELIKNALKDKKVLSKVIVDLYDSKKWHEIIGECIPRPLTLDIFDQYGLTLKFLKEEDYSSLAKQWLKEMKPNKAIPHEIQKFLTEARVLELLENGSARDLDYKQLAKDAQTKNVATWFLAKSHNPEKFYNSLSKEVKADIDVSDMLCKKDKQFYKIIPAQHQANDKIIRHVIDNTKYSDCDTVADSIDHTAILTSELPLHAVREIKDIYLIKKVLKNNPQFYTDKEVQEKWFKDNQNKTLLAEYLSFFPALSNDELRKELLNKDINEQVSMVRQNNSLAKIILDKNDLNQNFEFLYNYSIDIKEGIKALELKELINNNLEQVVDFYVQKQKEGMKTQSHLKYHIEATLNFSLWLFEQNTEPHNLGAYKLMSTLLTFKPDILESNIDYLYRIDGHELRKNAMKIYEYMDQNNIEPVGTSKTNKIR